MQDVNADNPPLVPPQVLYWHTGMTTSVDAVMRHLAGIISPTRARARVNAASHEYSIRVPHVAKRPWKKIKCAVLNISGQPVSLAHVAQKPSPPYRSCRVNTEANGRAILVVEDEWLVRTEIASALRDAGWQVFEAGSGEAAIALAESCDNLGVVFTDIQLYGRRDGWDVAEAVRVAHPVAGVIYASGNEADRARGVAGSRFFDKPYRVAEILAACEEFLH